jgi:DNA helicase-2/ATP-dependent DNA helicase PcrA
VRRSLSSLLGDLNAPQRQAVTHGDGPLLILAGAGSGKTRVLTYRIAHLIALKGIVPSRILAFTFTNKAAEEMRGRVQGLLGGAASVWVGTFHGTCARILRMEARKLGFDTSFSIYDDQDQQDLMREILKAEGVSEKEFRPAAVLEKISACKNALVSPAEYRKTALSRYDSQAAELYERYQEQLKAKNAMDFDDLICNTLELFAVDGETARSYRERFDHVLVDEYQDTDHAQFKLIESLASKHRNLFVVGDDDQSIYGWRGADIGNILSFRDSFPDAEVVRLEQNYRSTGLILAAASAVVKNNASRMEKTLWTEAPAGFKLALNVARDEAEEAEGVVQAVRQISRDEGVEYNAFGVLYRTNAQSRSLETAFKRAGIPYHLVGGTAFYQRREVKDLIAYLKCIVNPMDDVSFKRIIDAPPRGAGRTSIERLESFCRTHGTSLEDASRMAGEVNGVPPSAARALATLAKSLERWRCSKGDTPLGLLMEDIIETTGYLERMRKEDGAEGPREENVLELLATCSHFAETREDPSLEAYVSEAVLLSSVDRWDPSRPAVTLMTAHNAKGLEFDVIFLVGMEDGLFPHLSSLDDRDRLEEERRLFYVGITRARKRVLCWAALRRRRGRAFMDSTLSRFLAEIPPELLDMGKSVQTDEEGWSGSYGDGDARRNAGASREAMMGWPGIGERVQHSTFGPGVVIERVHGGTPRCTVQFDDRSTRRILVRYLRRED